MKLDILTLPLALTRASGSPAVASLHDTTLTHKGTSNPTVNDLFFI